MLNNSSAILVSRIKGVKESGSPINTTSELEVRCTLLDNFSTFYYGEGRSFGSSINLRIQKHNATKSIETVIYDGKHYKIENILNDHHSSLFVILDCEEITDAKN